MQELTQARLKELLSYDPETGIFVWIRTTRIGKVAGVINKKGYLLIEINYKKHRAHRLAWLYVFGELPRSDLDHKNRVKTDNRIENLRYCSNMENHFNMGARSDNKSGFKGASWSKSNSKWVAKITVAGKQNHIGYFATAELAGAAYEAKASEFHGEFYRHAVAQ